MGRLESLPAATPMEDLRAQAAKQCGIGEGMKIKLVMGGKVLPETGVISDHKLLKSSGMNRVLVMASKPAPASAPPAQEPVRTKPKVDSSQQFADVEKHLDEAEERFAKYLAEKESLSAEDRQKQLLWFNSVVNTMTKVDGLKLSARDMYDSVDEGADISRGRTLIKRCSKLLDRVDAEKAKL